MFKSKCNALAESIIEKKYLAKNDKDSTDVFMRVAKVCSIPDVIDELKFNEVELQEEIYD